MQLKKLIKIKVLASDKRKKIISLTPKGIELQDKATDIPSSMFCKINNLSQKEVTDLVKILDKMNNQILE